MLALEKMLVNLEGKRALVAGVADADGYGFAIAKALAEAGASVCVATWPQALGIFETLLRRGKIDDARKMTTGENLEFEKIYPLDAEYDTLDEVPTDVRTHKRYADRGDFSVTGLARALKQDFGDECLDIVVHSLANGPEVKNALLDTSRRGYLSAVSASAYSFVSLTRHLGPLLRKNASFLCLSYLAAERVIPGYGGGMSSAKAALENDTRVLAYEAGRRWGARVNAISAGPLASRAAQAIGSVETMIENVAQSSPLPTPIAASEVGNAAAFLCSPLASGITASVIHVDHGYHAMGAPDLNS